MMNSSSFVCLVGDFLRILPWRIQSVKFTKFELVQCGCLYVRLFDKVLYWTTQAFFTQWKVERFTPEKLR